MDEFVTAAFGWKYVKIRQIQIVSETEQSRRLEVVNSNGDTHTHTHI